MRIGAGFEMTYECPAPTPMLLSLSVHASRRGDLETPDVLLSNPDLPVHQYIDGFGNICSRIVAPAGRLTLTADFIIRDDGRPDAYAPDATQIAVEDLPDEAVIFLLGSRYCETDKLSDIAWSLFGGTSPGWARVQAIVDYVHNHIRFGYHHASPTKTAFEAWQDGVGVCRDYAHLAVALCRCMNIPARYCTGYLPDIEVTAPVEVMDFAAWFDVYLGGSWYTFDARNHRPRIGRILMARGRDATDVALANTFGQADLVGFTVVSSEMAKAAAV